MIILTWMTEKSSGPRAGDLEGSSLHSQRRVLLPGEEAFFYENGRGGKTGAAGSEKRERTDISLERRRFEPGDGGTDAESVQGSGRKERQISKSGH